MNDPTYRHGRERAPIGTAAGEWNKVFFAGCHVADRRCPTCGAPVRGVDGTPCAHCHAAKLAAISAEEELETLRRLLAQLGRPSTGRVTERRIAELEAQIAGNRRGAA